MKMAKMLRLCVCLCVCLSISADYLNQFAVHFDGDHQEMEELAHSMGFSVRQQLKNIGVFILTHSQVEHRSKRSATSHVDLLNSHPQIKKADQEILLEREKRSIIHDKQLELPIREIKDNSIYHRVHEARLSSRSNVEYMVQFTDPCFFDQWNMRNYGQTGGKIGLDLNCDPAWSKGITGKGIVVTVLDDGIDHSHKDLIDNYDSNASADYNDPRDKADDPMPDMSTPEKADSNTHGTRCAGVVAASAMNDMCGVGVAYDARIGGIRVLDGKVTDALEAAALNHRLDYIDIFSASWGPTDNGKVMEGPGPLAKAALSKGVRQGRGGKGALYVWATGNGGMYGDDCGCDGYVSSVETLSFGAVTDRGMKPYFMELCTSTLATVASGGEVEVGEEAEMGITKVKTVTTDVNDGCIENFVGTSSAAPMAAGCVALVLQANYNVTWRDVQHIIVYSSRIPSVDHSWIVNGAGLHVSHSFGFGLLDCGRMVELAEKWVNVPEQHMCTVKRKNLKKVIETEGTVIDEVEVEGCKGANRVNRLEHVQVHVKLDHNRRGDVQIFIVSPSNTWSEILSPRPFDKNANGIDFTFMTVHSWAEDPIGKWSLHVIDHPRKEGNVNSGMLHEWTLTLYGTAGSLTQQPIPPPETGRKAHFPNLVEVRDIMNSEDFRTNLAHVEPAMVYKKGFQEKSKTLYMDDLAASLKARKLGTSEASSNRKFFDLIQRSLKNEDGHDKRDDLDSLSERELEEKLISVLVNELKEEKTEKLKEEEKRKLEEEKKKREEEKRNEEIQLESLVDLAKKLKLEREEEKRKEDMTEEKRIENLMKDLRKKKELKEFKTNHQREENILSEVLLAAKKELKENPSLIGQVEKKITSNQEYSEKRVLLEVKKALEEERQKGSLRSYTQEKKIIEREEETIRTMADLLKYLKEN